MTQHDKVLYLLRSGPKTTNEIMASGLGLGSEYRARISELRGQGYVIDCDIHRGGASVWTLVSEPARIEVSGQLNFLDKVSIGA